LTVDSRGWLVNKSRSTRQSSPMTHGWLRMTLRPGRYPIWFP
jgi:hypothetical protein